MTMRIPVDEPFWIGDRCFTPEDVRIIQETVYRCRRLSRQEITATICENLPWKAPNGRLKLAACRELLADCEEQGLLTLPPKRHTGSSSSVQESHAPPIPGFPLATSLGSIRPVTLDAVAPSELRTWNATMAAWHPLGYRRPIGAHQRYWIRAQVGPDRQILGALLFGAAAKAVAARDTWLGWTAAERSRFRWRIVNNNRFLILPGIQVPHLASHVLGLAARQLRADWQARYGYQPVLLETFVEAPWAGTCYQAANWQLLGETAGRGRQDRFHESPTSIKTLWVYPLGRRWRSQLCVSAPEPRDEDDDEDDGLH